MYAILKLEGVQHLICILPTRVGKSVLFIALAVICG